MFNNAFYEDISYGITGIQIQYYNPSYYTKIFDRLELTHVYDNRSQIICITQSRMCITDISNLMITRKHLYK